MIRYNSIKNQIDIYSILKKNQKIPISNDIYISEIKINITQARGILQWIKKS
jgi:hypothetical protein